MGLKEEAKKAYAREMAELHRIREKENAEKEEWILDRLIELCGEDTIRDSNVISRGGEVNIDGFLFRARKEGSAYYWLQSTYNTVVRDSPDLVTLGEMIHIASNLKGRGGE